MRITAEKDRRRVLGPASGSYGSRLAWDRTGFLYVSLGDRNYPPASQNPASHIGKILRIRDDGTVPADNPFVSRPGYKPEIYSLGHRNPLGLAIHPVTGELWSTEEGPQGGDELNKIEMGKNYGWPRVSLGRNYDGTRVGEGFSAPGLEEPVVFWVPAIAISGLSFYDGDKFPRGKATRWSARCATTPASTSSACSSTRRASRRARDLPRRAQAAHPRGEACA
jgi:glucose/arabinose dehydrogenase